MARIVFRPHNLGSNGLNNLVEALRENNPFHSRTTKRNIIRIRDNGAYRFRQGDLVINWGSSEELLRPIGNVFNDPRIVANSANKLRAFNMFSAQNVRVPDYTQQRAIAEDWHLHGHTVIERHILNGSGGDGIIVCPPNSAQVVGQAPLYTKYIKKKNEYRIHVFAGEVIDKQEKRRRRDLPDDNRQTLIRNLANGYVFCHDDVNPNRDVIVQAKAAVEALGLNFGAVDVIWNERRQEAYVLEVNTAPGLEGQTVEAYKNAVIGLIR